MENDLIKQREAAFPPNHTVVLVESVLVDNCLYDKGRIEYLRTSFKRDINELVTQVSNLSAALEGEQEKTAILREMSWRMRLRFLFLGRAFNA